MKQAINNFINSIDTKLYNRIRASKGDAECRRYLKEHLQKKLTLTDVSQQRELLEFFVETQASELFKTQRGYSYRPNAIEETIKNFNCS